MVGEALKDIKIGEKTYTLYSTTGTVLDSKKWNETQVSGSGGGGGGRVSTDFLGNTSGNIRIKPVKISSQTVVHDQLFLIDEQGQEHDFQLQNFNLACRKDNKLTVVFASEKGKNKGYDIIVYNHSTRKSFFNIPVLSLLHRPSILWDSIYLAVVFIFIPKILSGFVLVFCAIIIALALAPGILNNIKDSTAERRAEAFINSNEVKNVIDYIATNI